ncbi:MAG TPA: MmgE/PrpD family protein, partial [Aminivibrio sp.]|nr:MmgE/PrpD family protein [Aminivibrio sp.]
LNDGRVFNLQETFPKGHPKNPFSSDELLWKFRTLAGKALEDENRVDRIIEAVLHMEDLESFNELTGLLSASD